MDSHKPLTAGEIEELKEEIRTMPHKEFFGENLQPLVDDHSRLSAMLTPPPDAAVKEAVERLTQRCDHDEMEGWSSISINIKDIRTLLRAVQAPPRLTEEQEEAVQFACSILNGKNGDRAYARRSIKKAFPAAFPGLFGKE